MLKEGYLHLVRKLIQEQSLAVYRSLISHVPKKSHLKKQITFYFRDKTKGAFRQAEVS